jgi:CHASE2 domain-containing sensor protein
MNPGDLEDQPQKQQQSVGDVQMEGSNHTLSVIQAEGSVTLTQNKIIQQIYEDKGRAALNDLLKSCTVRLSIPGQTGFSTGFFIASGKILTCARAVKGADEHPIQVSWQDQENLEATVSEVFLEPIGLAVLQLSSDAVTHPCAYLDKAVQAGDELYTYGYSNEFAQGGYIEGYCQEQTGDNPQIVRFKAKQTASELGDLPMLSGSPVLNWRTLKVCGIVKSTRTSNRHVTGEAISVGSILAKINGLKDTQAKFHRKDRRWSSLLPLVRCRPRKVVFASLGVAILIVFIRSLQVFQPLELNFYDQLMRSRFSPPKPLDRFLIIKITRHDAEAQEKRGEVMTYSLSNVTLARLLQKVQTLKPTAIGLDIYREQALNVPAATQSAPTIQASPAQPTPVQPALTARPNQTAKPTPTPKLTSTAQQNQSAQSTLSKPALAKPTAAIEQEQMAKQTLEVLFQQPNLFAVCKVGDEKDPEGISPPPSVTSDRVGFSDFSQDGDEILRRQLLAFYNDKATHPRCPSTESFSLLLARHYLRTRANIETKVDPAKEGCQVKFSNGVVLTNLQPNTGGYQGYSGDASALFNGCQILLNYREQTKEQAYKAVTLEEFLKPDFPAKDYNNRIVMIGIDRSDGISDNWNTPYDPGSDRVTPGVIVQAHMIDQILDVAAKKDTLIWVLPRGWDFLLIFGFALVGGGVGWWLVSLRQLGGFIVISCGVMLIISIGIFQFKGWVPLLPQSLALSATGSYIWWSNLRLKLDPKAK